MRLPQSCPFAWRFGSSLVVLATVLFGCQHDTSDTPDAGSINDAGPLAIDAGFDAGIGASDCAGAVIVTSGFLAAPGSSQAVAALVVTPFGPRLSFADNSVDGCGLEDPFETEGEAPSSGTVSILRLMLPLDAGVGTYASFSDGGADFVVAYSYASGEVEIFPQLVSGSLTLTTADATGFAGSYHLDFGPSVGLANSSEVIEAGSFTAPRCDFCSPPPPCGSRAACGADEVCFRLCPGGAGTCIPAPTCSGPASCQSCSFPSGEMCGQSGSQLGPAHSDCATFDGVSAVCSCLP